MRVNSRMILTAAAAVVAIASASAVAQWTFGVTTTRTAPSPAPVASGPIPPSSLPSAPPMPTVTPMPTVPAGVTPMSPPAADPTPARRREAVISMPKGTFVKSFEVEPFCKGRLVWTYEEDGRVSGTVELESEMIGTSAELAIESEVAMSSSGVVFGVVTGVKLVDLKVNPQMLAEVTKEFPFKVGPKFYPLIEPLVNDVLVDTPFSYTCRVRGDKMTISNARILASGPVAKSLIVVAAPFAAAAQAPAIALEGTYTMADKDAVPEKKAAPKVMPPTRRK